MRLLLLFATAVVVSAQNVPPYQPPTQSQRLKWATFATLGPPNIAAGAITAAISTASNNPPEYGPHWEGWGKRQGMRLTGSATSNLMEVELGGLWGEDPRYRRASEHGVGPRLWHAIRTSVLAYDRNGNTMPAYSRFIAIPAGSAISNSWRPDSQRTAAQTGTRIYLGFLARMASNTFVEFWPDFSRKFRH